MDSIALAHQSLLKDLEAWICYLHGHCVSIQVSIYRWLITKLINLCQIQCFFFFFYLYKHLCEGLPSHSSILYSSSCKNLIFIFFFSLMNELWTCSSSSTSTCSLLFTLLFLERARCDSEATICCPDAADLQDASRLLCTCFCKCCPLHGCRAAATEPAHSCWCFVNMQLVNFCFLAVQYLAPGIICAVQLLV